MTKKIRITLIAALLVLATCASFTTVFAKFIKSLPVGDGAFNLRITADSACTHNVTTWTAVNAAQHSGTCTICQETVYEDHSFTNNVCDTCGYINDAVDESDWGTYIGRGEIDGSPIYIYGDNTLVYTSSDDLSARPDIEEWLLASRTEIGDAIAAEDLPGLLAGLPSNSYTIRTLFHMTTAGDDNGALTSLFDAGVNVTFCLESLLSGANYRTGDYVFVRYDGMNGEGWYLVDVVSAANGNHLMTLDLSEVPTADDLANLSFLIMRPTYSDDGVTGPVDTDPQTTVVIDPDILPDMQDNGNGNIEGTVSDLLHLYVDNGTAVTVPDNLQYADPDNPDDSIDYADHIAAYDEFLNIFYSVENFADLYYPLYDVNNNDFSETFAEWMSEEAGIEASVHEMYALVCDGFETNGSITTYSLFPSPYEDKPIVRAMVSFLNSESGEYEHYILAAKCVTVVDEAGVPIINGFGNGFTAVKYELSKELIARAKTDIAIVSIMSFYLPEQE